MCPMNFNKFPMDTQTCKFQVSRIFFNQKLRKSFQKHLRESQQLFKILWISFLTEKISINDSQMSVSLSIFD